MGNIGVLRRPEVEAKRRANHAAYWERVHAGQGVRMTTHEQAVKAGLASGAARRVRGTLEGSSRGGRMSAQRPRDSKGRLLPKSATNGQTADLAEAIGALTAEQIVGAIQQRLDDLAQENAQLRGERDQLTEEVANCSRAYAGMTKVIDAARIQLDEARVMKEAADKEIYELRKENRQLAADLRAAKEKHGGLRLFRGA